jgi:hypothetical protein
VITLGTPHAGVPFARFAAIATLGLSPSMRQLVPGSRFLAQLAARPIPTGSELVAISGDADTLVPEHSSWLAIAPRQCSLRLRDMGHMQLVFHRDSLQLVGDLLAAPSAVAPSPRLPAHPTRHATRRAAALAVGQRALS